MTNLKKIGLTALAGSLAVTGFAQAGELSVNGTARMEYQSTKATATTAADTFAQTASITFSGSGELDNGNTVSFTSVRTGAATTSQSVTLDMGDMGTVSMASMNLAGIGTIQDMVPNGGEQPWDDLATGVGGHGTPEQGVASPHTANRLGYSNTMGGAIVSAAINYENNSPTTSIAIQLPNLVEGLNIGGGIASDASAAGVEDDIETMYVKYTMGSISVGYQTTDVDVTAATSDIERTSYGISFSVNDNLSIGYGVSDTEFEAQTLDEENAGIGIAYTSGGMKVGVIHNEKENEGGANVDHEMTELQLTFAF